MRSNQGLTLIELLVATAVTLLMVLAVSEAFVVIGETVSSNRASLEMSGQLRGVARRLQLDLDEITAPVEPQLKSEAGLGFFELIEGPSNDWDADQPFDLVGANATTTTLVYESYSNRNITPRSLDATEFLDVFTGDGNTARGDTDDLLHMTVRSSGEPFVGQIMGELRPRRLRSNDPDDPEIYGRELIYNPNAPSFTVIESATAEIVWFVANNNLHRRVLLVRPDIFIPADSPLQPTHQERIPYSFFASGNDLSVRLVPVANGFRRVTNSLSDLTLRQTRYGHRRSMVNNTTPSTLLADFPYPMNIVRTHEMDSRLSPKVNVYRRGGDNAWGSPASQDERFAGAIGSDDILIRYAQGEDIILTNVLAFDVQVYDPVAQVRAFLDNNGNAVELLSPGSPAFYSPNTPAQTVPVGFGAFVDLGYNWPIVAGDAHIRAFPNGLINASRAWQTGSGNPALTGAFIGPPNIFSQLLVPTFDTWPDDYERDGVNQDLVLPVAPANHRAVIDQGRNQRDENGIGGPDDVFERETQPPYGAPLTSIRVRLRLFDPDSRQVRQVTVSADFTVK
jgi:hypothetical protein